MPCGHGDYEECFCEYFPEVSRNIDGCEQLDETKRNEFYETVNREAGPTASKEEFDQCAKAYCYKNQLLGDDLDPRPKYIGRMHPLKTIGGILANRSEGEGVDKNFLLKYRDVVLSEKLHELDGLKRLLKSRSISDHLIWFFYVEGVEGATMSPFQDIDPLDVCKLPCRLGLTDKLRSTDFFPLEIETTEEMVLKKPTAFDAEMNKRWRPGGRTRPVTKECRGKGGFPEGVTRGGEKGPKFGDANVYIPPRVYMHASSCGASGKTIN